MTDLPPIHRLILIPAVLLAIWLCPCGATTARGHDRMEADHSCCATKHEQSSDHSRDPHDCPHCSGQQNLTVEKNKAPALSWEWTPVISLPASDALTNALAQCDGLPRQADVSAVNSPPIRLQTCTFLF